MSHDFVGNRLGDFEIVRELGRGGMGIVFEARQVSLNRRVALKVLAGVSLTGRAVERFRREAEAAAKLHHTNIVPVYATGEADGTHFYAMELIDGPSLDRVILASRASFGTGESQNQGLDRPGSRNDVEITGPYMDTSTTPLTPATASGSGLSSGTTYFDTAAKMIADVADALDHAHKHNILHRDIKPSNLLLSPDGRLSINDFGLARMLEQPGMTMTGEFVGTPAYMSPEQITAGRVPIDHRTDVYSLGATLFELLTLSRPFDGDRRDQVLAQVVQKDPVRPRKLNPKVPVDLETICLKCLEKDPDRRYQSGKELADDLRRYVNRFAISAKRVGAVGRMRKWVRRHPAVAGLSAAVAVVALAAGYFAYQSWQSARDREAQAGAAREKLRAEKMERVRDLILFGDFAAARAAMVEAEDLGAPIEWLDWRHGQITCHEGNLTAATERLEKVRGVPAARYLLGSIYIWTSRYDKHNEIANQLSDLTPVDAEDFLYLGLIESFQDTKRGLDTLLRAVTKRQSTIAYAILAQVYADNAMEQDDPADVRNAMAAARNAKGLFPDNRYVRTASLFAHSAARALGIAHRDGALRAAADEGLEDDMRWLRARLPDLQSLTVLAGTLQSVGRVEEGLKLLEMGRSGPGWNDWNEITYALDLFLVGRAAEAVPLAEKVRLGGPPQALGRAVMLLGKPGDARAALRATCDELEAAFGRHETLFSVALFHQISGRPDRAIRLLDRARENPALYPELARDMYEPVEVFLRAPAVTPEAVRKLLTSGRPKSRRYLVMAHYFIGGRYLAEGNRALARQSFQDAIDTGMFYGFEPHLSRAFLVLLKDPAWPPWAAEKK